MGNRYNDYLPAEQWAAMTSEQRRAHLENRRRSSSTPTTVPQTVQVHAQTVDTASVVTTPTAAPPQPGSTIRNMLSNATNRSVATTATSTNAPTNDTSTDITINGATNCHVGVHKLTYSI